MSFELAHLTDVHLGPLPRAKLRELLSKRVLGYISWKRRRHLLHKLDLLDAIRRDLRDRPPDHTVVTGDLVNIALPDEFRQAADWLRELGDPGDVSVIPGNHDAYVRGQPDRGWRHWDAYMGVASGASSGAIFPYVRQFGQIALIGLSSAVPSPPGFAYGKLGRVQVVALAETLDRLDQEGATRVVMVHHPPMFSPWRRALRDRHELRETIAKHGAELMISGHEHFFQTGMLTGPQHSVPLVVGPSASLMRFDGEHSGGYVRYRFSPKPRAAIEMTRFRYDSDADRMVPSEPMSLTADGPQPVLAAG